MKNKNRVRLNGCVVYVRSTSVEHGSSEFQEQMCRVYAKVHGFEVLEVFTEKGLLRQITDRGALKRMKAYVSNRANKVGYIVVWKVDRLSRNLMDYFLLKKFFKAHGAEVRSASENIENTPLGKTVEAALAATAQYEDEIHSERIKAGLKK